MKKLFLIPGLLMMVSSSLGASNKGKLILSYKGIDLGEIVDFDDNLENDEIIVKVENFLAKIFVKYKDKVRVAAKEKDDDCFFIRDKKNIIDLLKKVKNLDSEMTTNIFKEKNKKIDIKCDIKNNNKDCKLFYEKNGKLATEAKCKFKDSKLESFDFPYKDIKIYRREN